MLDKDRSSESLWASIHSVSSVLKAISKKREHLEGSSLNTNDSVLLDVSKGEEENTNIFLSLFTHSTIKSIVKICIEDSYKYNFNKTESFKVAFKNTLKDDKKSRKNVSLQKHTFGTFNQMYKLIGKKFGLHSELFYLLAFVHDFGKSSELKKAKNIDMSVRHHTASALYLKSIMLDIKEISAESQKLLEKVCTVLEAHHTEELANKFYAIKDDEDSMEFEILLLKNLISADSKQTEIDIKEGKES